MTWSSWKPKGKRRPPGEWREVGEPTALVGIIRRAKALVAFTKGAMAAHERGDGWGLILEREPENPRHPNAIKVHGHWTERGTELFRSGIALRRQVHLGYLNDAVADKIAVLGATVPLAAELEEVLADDARQQGMRIGAVIKVIVLVPSGSPT